jgi:drug/metabolite transporter (DMT)-like permease
VNLLGAIDFPIHLLFPFASSLLYVAAALSLKRASQEGAGVWRSTFALNLAAAACFMVLLLFEKPGLGPTPIWQPIIIASLFVAGQASTMLALNRGDVSVATPVVGTKVVFVAFFVSLVVGDPVIIDHWISAGMSAAGIALLNMGGGAAAGKRKNLAFTIIFSLAAAACYGLFDALVRKWSPAWGVGRLLPTVMAMSAVMSLAFWPIFEGPLLQTPRPARWPLVLGSLFLGLQAVLLVRTLGTYPDTTRINVVYNSRGLWSVLAVWLVGHWWGNTERHAGGNVLLWRFGGAVLLLAAIAVSVLHPFTL